MECLPKRNGPVHFLMNKDVAALAKAWKNSRPRGSIWIVRMRWATFLRRPLRSRACQSVEKLPTSRKHMDCTDALGHLLGKAATWPRLPKRETTPDLKEAYGLCGCDGPPSWEGRYVAALAKAWNNSRPQGSVWIVRMR